MAKDGKAWWRLILSLQPIAREQFNIPETGNSCDSYVLLSIHSLALILHQFRTRLAVGCQPLPVVTI
jgi:hypothetical protein